MEIEQSLADPANQSLALLQSLWRGHDPDSWSTNPDVFIALAERVLKLGEPLFAYDVVDEGIKRFPTNVRLRQLLALALARSGATGSANAVLVKLYQEGLRDEETIGLLARTHKDLADEAPDPAQAVVHLRQAYVFYSQAYEHTGGYWSAINAATLALALGDRERAAALAREITVQCRERLTQLLRLTAIASGSFPPSEGRPCCREIGRTRRTGIARRSRSHQETGAACKRHGAPREC